MQGRQKKNNIGGGGGGAPLRRIDSITHTLTFKLYILSICCDNHPLCPIGNVFLSGSTGPSKQKI